VLKEACEGPWTSGFFGVDLDGQSYQAAPSASGVLSWIQDDNARNIALADTREAYVIFDSQAIRAKDCLRYPKTRPCFRAERLSKCVDLASAV
jgi:hypothetical protein